MKKISEAEYLRVEWRNTRMACFLVLGGVFAVVLGMPFAVVMIVGFPILTVICISNWINEFRRSDPRQHRW